MPDYAKLSDAELVRDGDLGMRGNGSIVEMQRRAKEVEERLTAAIGQLETKIERNASVTEKQTTVVIWLTVVLVAFGLMQIVVMLVAG